MAASTPQMVFAYNHPSKKAAIYGELDDQGVVTFAVQASKDSPIRGTELFRRMMSAFGDDALSIRGVWRKGKGPSINIDKVNEMTQDPGVSLEEALSHAWTVTRARRFGFDTVRLLSSEGSPGAYVKIDVAMEK